MGAETFWNIGVGATPAEAFAVLVKDSREAHGSQYSGEIGMKNSFKEIRVPDGKDPRSFANELLDDEKHWVQNKWEPAACVKLTEGKWLFFGYASS